MSLSHSEWRKLRDMINAWPDDSDRIMMHRVINRELTPEDDPERGWVTNHRGQVEAAIGRGLLPEELTQADGLEGLTSYHKAVVNKLVRYNAVLCALYLKEVCRRGQYVSLMTIKEYMDDLRVCK